MQTTPDFRSSYYPPSTVPKARIHHPLRPRRSDMPFNLVFFKTDHLGTPRVITDRDGKVLSTHDYLAYGEELTDPDFQTNRMKFTGHERDPETGLDYMLARYYTSGSGRFLQVDPGYDYDPMDPMSFNLYGYVRGNPIMSLDLTGMKKRRSMFKRIVMWLKPKLKAAGSIVGGALTAVGLYSLGKWLHRLNTDKLGEERHQALNDIADGKNDDEANIKYQKTQKKTKKLMNEGITKMLKNLPGSEVGELKDASDVLENAKKAFNEMRESQQTQSEPAVERNSNFMRLSTVNYALVNFGSDYHFRGHEGDLVYNDEGNIEIVGIIRHGVFHRFSEAERMKYESAYNQRQHNE